LAGYRAFSMQTPGESQTAALNGAIGDFKQALTTASYDEKSEIYAMLAVTYRQQHDTKNEIASLNSAIQVQDDPTLRLVLGKEYLANGDKANALVQYAAASQHAYTNPEIHTDLVTEYTKMGETKLAGSEKDWLAKYAKSQKQANAAGGTPFNVKPGP
jgi:Tfp pilus assembly protein PilF